MSAAIHLLPQYAFMALTRTAWLYLRMLRYTQNAKTLTILVFVTSYSCTNLD
jgi:hypothetical protein